MDLNINSPAYFKEKYGIDDEVYRFCQKVNLFFKDKEYSNTLHTIGIVPVAAPQEIYDTGAQKENIKYLNHNSVVSVTIRINFEDYCKADSLGKVEQTKEMILMAARRIKLRGKFDYDKFKEDFLSLK